jgi:Spy/CpxP family protein refolding chaperone
MFQKEIYMISSPNTTLLDTIRTKTFMKMRTLALLLAAAAIAATVPLTFAQTGGYGPGMMGGYGGYGMGPGMMGGYGGYGMGPGMTGGGYGPGPGMMYGYGGHPPGAGMMGGYGGYGMGPGMMYGYGGDFDGALNLSDDQREKITKIQEALFTKHWELMGKMQQQQFALREELASGKVDDATIGKAYKNIEGLRQQMWTSRADAQKQIDAVLTKSQREQLQRGRVGDAK